MVDLDRRTYDLLRLIHAEGPVGSIRLTDLMQRRGYTIQGRTIRIALSDLDDAGLTEKVSGRGRRMTEEGRRELERGDVTGRREQVRERIATLTDRVTYDPYDDEGRVVTTMVTVPHADVADVIELLRMLDDTPLGPVVGSVEETAEGDTVRFEFPSSVTVKGALLAYGIDVDLKAAGLIEYHTAGSAETGSGGTVDRYVDTISGAESTMDVVTLLIEASRTNVSAALDGSGILIVDNYEFPILRLDECIDLVSALQSAVGGVADIRRPREDGPFPGTRPGFDFASLTYGGIGELAVALLVEAGFPETWETLAGTADRAEFVPIERLSL